MKRGYDLMFENFFFFTFFFLCHNHFPVSTNWESFFPFFFLCQSALRWQLHMQWNFRWSHEGGGGGVVSAGDPLPPSGSATNCKVHANVWLCALNSKRQKRQNHFPTFAEAAPSLSPSLLWTVHSGVIISWCGKSRSQYQNFMAVVYHN